MPKKKIVSAYYKDLIASVTSTLYLGLLAAKKNLEYQRLKTYWDVGKRIRGIVARSGGTLVLGEKLYKEISRDLKEGLDLDLSADTIQRAVQFHKNYPQFPKNSPLTFTHYMALQRIAEPAKRARLEAKAIKNNMSSPEVKEAILKMKAAKNLAAAQKAKTLVFKRGEPFVYATIVNVDPKGERKVCVDCGFKMDVDMPKDNLYKPQRKHLVRSIKKDGVYRIVRPRDRRTVGRYTYSASVKRVVDGDTMDVRIDVGFGIHLNDRLRFKGINAPKINTQEGKAAKKFLEKQLENCSVIIVRTEKSGMYGRWIAGVFILPHCDDLFKIAAEGTYLNQLMLDEGHAKLYRFN
ncbi:MAG: thermonuclease family protein [Candidatus Omnitrophica bacterium]|nr:thermonuclease family protein [Candidatus Omnitrophota bacterium]